MSWQERQGSRWRRRLLVDCFERTVWHAVHQSRARVRRVWVAPLDGAHQRESPNGRAFVGAADFDAPGCFDRVVAAARSVDAGRVVRPGAGCVCRERSRRSSDRRVHLVERPWVGVERAARRCDEPDPVAARCGSAAPACPTKPRPEASNSTPAASDARCVAHLRGVPCACPIYRVRAGPSQVRGIFRRRGGGCRAPPGSAGSGGFGFLAGVDLFE